MPIFLFLVLSLSGPPAVAQVVDPLEPTGENESNQPFEYDDSHDKVWAESATELKSLPADETLYKVDMDDLQRGLSLYLDLDRLTLNDADRVLRFWVVIRSEAGAYNATFEGLRCDTHEYKVYAYGRRRGQPAVQPAPKPRWLAISQLPGDHYRAELVKFYLCQERAPNSPDKIRRLVRYAVPDASDDTDRTAN